MKTVVVLGFDALEYSLVEEYKLDSIKQERYTKTDLSQFEVLSTPVIWSSMLIGEIDSELENKYKGELGPIRKIVKEFIPRDVREEMSQWLDNFRDDESATFMPRTGSWLRDKGIDSILEQANSWHSKIPGHSGQVQWDVKRVELTKKYLSGDKKAGRKFREACWTRYKKTKKDLLDALENKNRHELLFYYTDFLDKMGHLFHSNSLKRMKWYMDAHEFVKNVQNQLDNEDILYIISDHGMEVKEDGSGDHTDYGFFSSNTGDLIERPQDLCSLLEEKVL